MSWRSSGFKKKMIVSLLAIVMVTGGWLGLAKPVSAALDIQ